jgi:hypothetical protein
MIAQCSCGSVALDAVGVPLASAVCYCDTCQAGSQQLEALPNADPIRDAAGGTPYLLYRTDRVRYVRGADLVHSLKLTESGATARVYAGCCNASMVMRFDDARHWVCVYRARFHGDVPPVQFRICTSFSRERAKIPNDVPSFAMYPLGLLRTLLAAKMATLFQRP